MKRPDNKSHCPVNFALETFGDTWSLLIIRDIVSDGKHTFNEFLSSKESIGPSVLAGKLGQLEQRGIITSRPDPHDKRCILYALTKSGLDVLPVMYELSVWGVLKSANPDTSGAWLRALKLDRIRVLDAWRLAIQSGDSFSLGRYSVVRQLHLI